MIREVLLIGLLAGCAAPTVVTQEQPNAAIAVPVAQPMTLNSVQWQAMTATELRSLANKLQKAQDNRVVLVLDADNYNNLSLNLIEIERYIKEQKAILDMLKAVIDERANLHSQDK